MTELLTQLGVGGLLIYLFLRELFGFLKARRNGELEGKTPVIMCPLDRKGTIKNIEDLEEGLEKMTEKLNTIGANLDHGVKVAERNTEHSEEFVKTLANLTNASSNMLEELKDLNKSAQEQIKLLIQIQKNGGR